MMANSSSSSSSVYQCPAVQRPTVEQLQSLAQAAQLHISADDLQQYKDCLSQILNNYDYIDKLPEPLPVSKYPTTAGYQPTHYQNPYNAWARITNITGSECGKLFGKSVAVKDCIHVSGVPLLNGSNFMRGFVSSYTATTVCRVLDAGGKIKGKSTCENMCFSGSSFTSASGPVLNPFDVTRSAGGSSSGSAVLVAIGEVDMALGTDSGGSIRLPSCWCGVVGLKPTYGLVPITGVQYLDRIVDHIGPIARTVYDCALLLEVTAGYDNGLDSSQSSVFTVPNYTQQLTGDVNGLRVGVLKEGFDGCEADVAETVRNAVNSLKQLGVTVEEFSSTLHNDLRLIASLLCTEGSYDTYCNGGLSPLSCRGFQDTSTHDFMFNASHSMADSLPTSMKMVLLQGSYIRREKSDAENQDNIMLSLIGAINGVLLTRQKNYGCHFYSKSINILRQLTADYDQLFQRYDVIAMPTIKFKPPKLPPAGVTVSEYLMDSMLMIENTFPYNATGHPALTINAGFSDTQPCLPIGIQFVGRRHDDVTVLRLAHAYERLRDSLATYKQVDTKLPFKAHCN